MSEKNVWLEGENFLKTVEPVFADLIAKYGPCTLTTVPPEKYYITLIKGVLAQQVASDVSQLLFAEFKSKFGENPDPAVVYAAKIADITGCGVSEQKARYIMDLSEHVLNKKIIPEKFPEMDDAAIIKQLAGIKGFGRWTAELFLILALNRQDVLPADDFGMKKAMKELFSLPAVPQKRGQATKLAEPWRPWRSLATWYLWQSFAHVYS